MPVFRKKKFPLRIVTSSEVYEERPKFVSEDNDGVIEQRLVFECVNVVDPIGIAAIPDKEDYTLNNILRSGVPINEVKCGSLLNPTDPAEIEEHAVEMALNISEPEHAQSEESIPKPTEETPVEPTND